MIISISGSILKNYSCKKMLCQVYFHGKKTLDIARTKRLVKRQANNET